MNNFAFELGRPIKAGREACPKADDVSGVLRATFYLAPDVRLRVSHSLHPANILAVAIYAYFWHAGE